MVCLFTIHSLPAFVVLIRSEIVRQRRWRRLATEDAGVDNSNCAENYFHWSFSVVAGDQTCWWGTVTDRGSEVPPPQYIFWNLIDLISCILVHFGDGHYLFTCFSFRFIAYILTCRAWTSLHCIYRPTSWPFHQPLLFDPLLLFWYWDKSWSLSYSVHFLWVSMSTSNAVRNMGQLLHFVYMLQAERLN